MYIINIIKMTVKLNISYRFTLWQTYMNICTYEYLFKIRVFNTSYRGGYLVHIFFIRYKEVRLGNKMVVQVGRLSL